MNAIAITSIAKSRGNWFDATSITTISKVDIAMDTSQNAGDETAFLLRPFRRRKKIAVIYSSKLATIGIIPSAIQSTYGCSPGATVMSKIIPATINNAKNSTAAPHKKMQTIPANRLIIDDS